MVLAHTIESQMQGMIRVEVRNMDGFHKVFERLVFSPIDKRKFQSLSGQHSLKVILRDHRPGTKLTGAGLFDHILDTHPCRENLRSLPHDLKHGALVGFYASAVAGQMDELLDLKRDSHVLDVAAGRGTSAFHLAESFGCKITGVDLSEENVRAATVEAANRGLDQLVAFHLGDAERLPFDEDSFDAIVCECAFCTFPNKSIAAHEFYRVLKPDGKVGLSDLTRTKEQIPGLEGLLSWIACIGDALPVEGYDGILEGVRFKMQGAEDHSDALLEMVRQVQAKLLGTEILAGLKKIDLPGVDFTTGKQFAHAALQAVREGNLGYVVVISRK